MLGLATEPPTVEPVPAGMERMRVLTALSGARSTSETSALRSVEERTEWVIRALFHDGEEKERAWYAACVPLALDALAIARLLPLDEDDFRRLAQSTAGVVFSWLPQLDEGVAFTSAPSVRSTQDALPMRTQPVFAHQDIVEAALEALGRAKLGDLLALLTPTLVSARSGGAVSRLQVARAFSDQESAAFEPSLLIGALAGMSASYWPLLSASAASTRLNDDAWRVGMSESPDAERGWALAAELITWLCITVGRTDPFARGHVAEPLLADLRADLTALPRGRPAWHTGSPQTPL